MSTASPLDSPLFGNPTSIALDSKSGEHTFLFPDIDNTKRHVEGILKGYEYRVLPIEGYEVDTIVDIGANIGAFAVYMALQFPDAQSYCFEPSAGALLYFRENTKAFPNIHLYEYGLYSDDCEMTLFDGAAQGLQNSLFKSAETANTGNVVQLKSANRTFSDLNLSQISILKIDTEGAEVPILGSLLDVLCRIDQIYVEYHSEQDRREIESLLSGTHVLAGALSNSVHLGINHYLSKTVLETFPHLELRKIERD